MVQLAKDTIDSKDLEALSSWLLTTPKLTMGDLTEQFEKEIALKNNSRYAVMVNSGSSANLLMLQALSIFETLSSNKIVVPAVCWATDVSPVIQLGFEPVFCDINKRNLAVDTSKLEQIFINEKPAALLLVSILGLPPDMDEVKYLCDKYNVILLEDNCESLGSCFDGQPLGTFGLASTTSLYYGHHISTIEGGVIFTDNARFNDILRMCRAHGWTRNIEPLRASAMDAMYKISPFDSKFTFYYHGFNFRPTEINAFLGLFQLKKLDDIIRKRNKNFEYYQHSIKNNYWKPEIPKENYVSSLGYPLIHPERNKIATVLTAREVECRPLVSGNITRQPFLSDKDYGRFSFADIVHANGMYLPNHPFLKESEIDLICKTVNSITS